MMDREMVGRQLDDLLPGDSMEIDKDTLEKRGARAPQDFFHPWAASLGLFRNQKSA
jgi:hypothetical protein